MEFFADAVFMSDWNECGCRSVIETGGREGEMMQHTPCGRAAGGRNLAIPPRLETEIVADMEELGLDPAYIYAFQHTGMMVTDSTLDCYTDSELLGWQDALNRYRQLAA